MLSSALLHKSACAGGAVPGQSEAAMGLKSEKERATAALEAEKGKCPKRDNFLSTSCLVPLLFFFSLIFSSSHHLLVFSPSSTHREERTKRRNRTTKTRYWSGRRQGRCFLLTTQVRVGILVHTLRILPPAQNYHLAYIHTHPQSAIGPSLPVSCVTVCFLHGS